MIHRRMRIRLVRLLPLVLATLVPSLIAQEGVAPVSSSGTYRAPYADDVRVKVFDDFQTHRPIGRIDFYAVAGAQPYRVTAGEPH